MTSTNQPSRKLHIIMEAASALSALGDEDSPSPTPISTPQKISNSSNPSSEAASPTKAAEEKSPSKRFIPSHKKPDAALTFPEKLMKLMIFAEEKKQDNENFCVAWLPDGKSFVIRQPDEFTRQVLPKFFKATKFSSFTRKLYRWGFRQVNRGIGPDDPIIFGNENFQRDFAEDMTKMRSITAASSRKAEAQTIYGGAGKRSFDGLNDGPDHKRALLDHLLQQKAAGYNYHPNPTNMYGGMNAPGGAVSLTSALRPSLGMGVSQGHYNGLPAMMSKHMDIMNQQQQPHPNNGNFMGNYMPQNSNPNQISQQQQQQQQQQYPMGTSTADIVNAAISALRYAS